MLGSNAREDQCRECGGDGSSCNTVRGLVEIDYLQAGYNDILLIPAGATNIEIREVRASNNYLAIRNESGHYYLNGNWKIDYPRSLRFAGSIFHYERKPHSFYAPETITCLGPTSEPIYVVMLYQETNPGVEYQYSIPKGIAQQTDPDSYSWIYDDFSTCSATCGGGYQLRNVTCARRRDLEIVPDYLCDPVLEPKRNQSCSTDPCPPDWSLGGWGPCSETCGEGGVQIRQVYCERIVSNGLPSVVEDEQCSDVLGPKPPTTQECNQDVACPTWHVGPWKPCNRLCGDGVQKRRVRCYIRVEGKIQVLEDSACSEEKPQFEKPCLLRPCEGVDWVLSDWSGCEDKCGLTYETRKAHCSNQMGKVYPDNRCHRYRLPNLIRECENQVSCEYEWFASQWSECSAKCGNGIQTRKVFCGTFDGETVKKVSDGKCKEENKYEGLNNCTGKEECSGQWYSAPWSSCSKTCGGGLMTRKVLCFIENKTVDVRNCDPSLTPFSTESCNNQQCSRDQILPLEPATVVSEEEECIEEDETSFIVMDTTLGLGEMLWTQHWGSEKCYGHNTGARRNGKSVITQSVFIVMNTTQGSEKCYGHNTGARRNGKSVITQSVFIVMNTTQGSEKCHEHNTRARRNVMDTTLGLGEMGATPLFSVGGTDVSSDTSEISGMASELSSLSTQGSVGSSGLTSSASTDSSSLLTDFITPSSLDTATISQDVMLSDSTDVSSDSPLSSLSSDGIKLTELSSTSLSEEISSSLSSDLSATPGTTMSDYVNSTESSLSSLSDITSSSDIDSTFLSSDTSPASSGSLSTDSSSNGETLSTSSTDSLSSSSGSGSPKTDTTLSGGSSVSLNYYSSDLSSSSDGVSPQTDTTSSDSSSTSDTSSSSTSDTSSSSDDTSPPTIDTTSSSDSSSVSETIEGSGMTTGSLDVDELLTTLITGSGMSSLETKPSPDTDFVVEADFDESEGSGDLKAVSTPAAMSPSEISEGSTLFSQDTSTDSATESSSIFSTDIYSTLFTTLSSVFTTSSSEESTVYSTTESSPTEMFTESSYSESSSYESSSSESSSSEISSTEASSEISTIITTESIDLTSTESSSEISTSTDTTEYSTVGSTDVTSTEVSGSSAGGDGSTVSGDDEKEEVTTPSPAQVAVTNEQKERKCRRRKKPVQEPEVVKCEDSKFGCCSDGITEAKGPFNKGCPQPTTCSETEFKCCSDGVSPAEGPNEEGCPPSLCKETLFGCCPDGVNIAEGNDFEGCEEDMMPFLCNKTDKNQQLPIECTFKNSILQKRVNLLNRFGCCPDGLVAATGPDNEGCFTCEGSGECESCNDTKFGCCPDGLRAASGDNFTGCEQPEEGSGEGFLPVTKEPEPEVDCAESEHGCCPDGLTVATGPNFDGCGVIDTDNCTLSYFRCCPDGSTPGIYIRNICVFWDSDLWAHNMKVAACPVRMRFTVVVPTMSHRLMDLVKKAAVLTHHTVAALITFSRHREPTSKAVAASTVPIAAVPTMLRQLEDLTMRGAAVSTLLMGVVPMVTPLQRGPASRDVHAIPSNLDAVLMGSPSHGGLKTKVSDILRSLFAGCGCENTQFGCCSDDRTPASGPELEGCGCEASKFGCCPDGVVEAQGDKFEGCDDVPLIAAEACFLPKIEGPCEGYYPTWHYDAERKQCRQFIYGGCLGNNNKFQTREECDELCVTPDTIDACDQPKFEGPCRGNFSRWYFDKESGICSEFSYGGCKGNGNNFYTESACHQQCLQPGRSRAVMDVCALPKDMGPCPGAILRWHYDAIQQTCKQFVYGGCQGNGNRFRTEEDCRTKCHVSATTRDHCALPRAQGNCTERLPRWFFDAEENRCMPFYYTGCEGNDNRFETQEACETDCPPKVEQDTCTLPAMVGECHNYTERWYYDSFEVRCRPFYYGGCGGNHNNFHNMQDCQQRCEAGYNTPEPPEQFKTEYCFLPDDHGPCSESVAHWFYDSRDGVCKQFLYGGCQGNQNRFASRQDCEQSCGNVQDKCILPRVVGPCSGSIQQWYYEQRSNNCEEFDYGGCQGNANRFNDRQECEESCKRGVPEITTAGPRILEPKTDNSLSVFQPVDICLTHVDPGPCRGQNSAWYFDYSSLSCQAFVYGGCGGNANRFESEEQCERQCGIFKGQDVCTIPYEIGPCRGLFRKWYFDSTSGHCQEFDYGGCSGNGNRFSSISECESICLHREELLPTGDDTSLSHQGKALLTLYSPPTTNKPKTFPTWFLVAVCRLPVETGPCEGGYYKRWYFNQDHRTCIPFIYSGCAGNLNRFKNFQTCLNFCSVMLQEGGSGEPDDTQGQRKCTERVVSDANEIDVDSPREKADGLCAEAREECNKLHCPYRVEKFVDSSDCERCRCHDPCRDQYCPEDTLCAVDLYHNDETSRTEFRAICRQGWANFFLTRASSDSQFVPRAEDILP
uniref:BPTI/Kunitz inhibitor domain-containing protein n=1 Tax=Timema monikensis TaxID=170555 RepID=A0A7R9HKX0_9NEOP|nr:unnamed protein product [Timema monikensis]